MCTGCAQSHRVYRRPEISVAMGSHAGKIADVVEGVQRLGSTAQATSYQPVGASIPITKFVDDELTVLAYMNSGA
jgi:DNA gyrase inhibitor GyrI